MPLKLAKMDIVDGEQGHRRRRWGTFAGATMIIMAMAAVTGCATVHPTEPHAGLAAPAPRSAPSEASGKTGPTSDAAPSLKGENGLNLEQCIALALDNNPEVAATAWDAKAAAAEKDMQAGKRWPSVRLSGNYFHYQDAQRIVAPSVPSGASYFTGDLVTADLVIRLPLYAGGRITNGIRAAELLAQSAQHTLARTRKELVFNVSSTYYAILAQRRVLESLEFSRGVLEEHGHR